MKTVFNILSITFLIITFSCKQQPSEEAKAFDNEMEETVQIHDDVMPKMSEINSLITQLETEKEQLEEEDADAEDIELYAMSIDNLKEAHDLMMSWMKNFSNSFSRTEINSGLTTEDQDSIKAKRELLSSQYKSAKEMQKAISESIENAQSILAD